MSAWDSPIVRISTGFLNTVNDTVIANSSGITGASKFRGQLGKHLFVSHDQIASLTNTGVMVLYGGRYRYVRRRATDDDSPAVAGGKLAFWDTTVTSWQTAFQVTTDENLSSADNAVMVAGVWIGNIEPGNYGFIQDMGEVFVRFRSVLTSAGAIGGRAYAAGTGDIGGDQGTADMLATDSTSLAYSRYIGNAVEAPSGGSLSRVLLDLRNYIL